MVTDENVAILQALGLNEQGRKFETLAGLALIVAIEVLFLAIYINRFEKRTRGSRSLQFIAASLLTLFALLTAFQLFHRLHP